MTDNALVVFENYNIRRHFDESTEIWYFSVIDVVGVLTDSVNPRDYWFKMKTRVKSEDGLELSTICRQLKMKAPDGAGNPQQTDRLLERTLAKVLLPVRTFSRFQKQKDA